MDVKSFRKIFFFTILFLSFLCIDNVFAESKYLKVADCTSVAKYDTTLWKKYAVVSGADSSPPYGAWIEYTTTGTDTNLYCIEPGKILYYDRYNDYTKWATTEETYVSKTRYIDVARAIQYSGNPLVTSCSSSNIYTRIATGMLVQMIAANKSNSSGTNYWRVLTKSELTDLIISDKDTTIANKFIEIRDKTRYHSSMPFVANYDFAALTKDEAKKETTKYFSISGNNFTRTLSSSLFDIDYGWSVSSKDSGISSAEIKDGSITITAPINDSTVGKTMCVQIKKPIANGTLYATNVDDQDTAFFTKGAAKYKYSYICMKTSSFKVKKVDSSTDKPISGVKFNIYSDSSCKTAAKNAHGTTFGSATTNSSGYAYFYNLKDGTYYVKETSTPAGYITNSTCHKVKVSSLAGSITVENDPLQVKVKKVDATSTSKVLSGAKFQLYTNSSCSTVASDAKGAKFTAQTTNSSGYAYFDYVKKDTTYYVGEVTAPSGYVKDTSWCQKVDVSSSSVTKTFKNSPVQIKVKKVDSANKSKVLSGATFRLYTRSTCADVSLAKNSSGNVYSSVSTNSSGYAYFDKVQLSSVYTDSDGNYKFYVKETKSPSGYVIDNDKCTLVTVDAKTGVGSIEFSDTKISSTSVQVHKVDSYDGDPLKGVKITLYDDKCVTPSKRVANATKVTGSNGSVVWNDIDMTGITSLKLYVMEDKSSIPSGYIQQKENDCKEVVITSSDIVDGSIASGAAKNSAVIYNVPFGDIQLLKLDSNKEKAIKGVVFRLLDKDKNEVLDKDGNKVLDVTTNDEGIAKFTNILYGKYYLQEIKTDPNYKTITDLIEFELNENTDSVKLDINDDLVYYNGDVNTDGVIDVLDYNELNTMITEGNVIGLSKAKQYASDINSDGVIDKIDLRILDLTVNKKDDVLKYQSSLKVLCGEAVSCTLSSSFLKDIKYVGTLDNVGASNICYSSVVNPNPEPEPDTGNNVPAPGEIITDGQEPEIQEPEIVNPNTSSGSGCKFTSDSVKVIEDAIKNSKTSSLVADFNGDKVINESDVNLLKAYLNYRDNNKMTAVNDYVDAYESVGDLDADTVKVLSKVGTKVTIDSDSNILHSSIVITNTLIDMKISKLDITNQKELPGAEIVIKDSEGKEVIKFVSTDQVKQFNIPVGIYTLTETVAPKGYDRLTTDIKFEVLPDGNIKLLDVKSDSFKMIKSEDPIDTDTDHLVIYNSLTEVKIPDTGSVLTFVTIIVGIGLVGYGSYIFYDRYRNRLS